VQLTGIDCQLNTLLLRLGQCETQFGVLDRRASRSVSALMHGSALARTGQAASRKGAAAAAGQDPAAALAGSGGPYSAQRQGRPSRLTKGQAWVSRDPCQGYPTRPMRGLRWPAEPRRQPVRPSFYRPEPLPPVLSRPVGRAPLAAPGAAGAPAQLAQKQSLGGSVLFVGEDRQADPASPLEAAIERLRRGV
jgi:hypothetical protein